MHYLKLEFFITVNPSPFLLLGFSPFPLLPLLFPVPSLHPFPPPSLPSVSPSRGPIVRLEGLGS